MSLRTVFVIVLAAAVISTIAALLSALGGPFSASRLMNSAAALMGLASVLQLRVSGWFDFAMEQFGDVEKYPFGPPAHVTRDLIQIDNPEQPIRRVVRNFLFTNSETGFKLGVASLGSGPIKVLAVFSLF
jgi:hypothetical protein